MAGLNVCLLNLFYEHFTVRPGPGRRPHPDSLLKEASEEREEESILGSQLLEC